MRLPVMSEHIDPAKMYVLSFPSNESAPAYGAVPLAVSNDAEHPTFSYIQH